MFFSGRTSMPGRSIEMMKYEMPVYLLVSTSVRAMRMPNFATCASDVQIFLAVDDEHVAVTVGPRAEVGEVRPGLRFGEQLAPQLLAPKHRHQVAVLLFLGAVHDEHRAAVTDADRVRGSAHAGPLQLVVDDEL